MGAVAVLQDQRILEVNTPLGANTLVINHLSTTEGISDLFRFHLDLLAESSAKIKMKDLLGKAISINLMDGDDKRHFHGIVSRITEGPREQRFQHYMAEVVPWLWLLSLKSESRIFQDKTVIEIVKAVFDELKGSFPDVNYRDATTGDHIPLDFCVQYRESDLNFVSRLLEKDGIFYFFEHTEDKHTLVLADANSAIVNCQGNSQILYSEGGIGEREGIITSFAQQMELRSGKFTFRDHHFQLPGKSLEVTDQAQDSVASALEFYDYPGEFALRFKNPDQRLGQVEKEGDKLVRVRLDEELLAGQIFSGASTRRNLTTGHKFSLTKHFNSDGEYIVTSMNCSIAQSPDYISGKPSSGSPYGNTFTCVPATAHIRPKRDTAKPTISGPQTAMVAVKSGEESWLDKFGRVRVQFHWERKGKNNETSACWVRVAQPWAGASWGAHFWPRVGQEVVVEFLEGDPDRPIITGSVYNAANMPPYKLPDNYTRSGIISRSSKSGASKNFNELRFEDKMGQEQIFLNAEKDMDHRVEHDHRTFVGADQHLVVTGSQNESIGKDHSREVKGSHAEKIGGKFSLQAAEQHQKVDGVYTLEAGEIYLKAGSKIVIEAGAQISVKGPAGFVDISAAILSVVGTMVKINAGGSAASATSPSPDAPKKPDIADDGSKGAKLS